MHFRLSGVSTLPPFVYHINLNIFVHSVSAWICQQRLDTLRAFFGFRIVELMYWSWPFRTLVSRKCSLLVLINFHFVLQYNDGNIIKC